MFLQQVTTYQGTRPIQTELQGESKTESEPFVDASIALIPSNS
jgi:hypothetical protein